MEVYALQVHLFLKYIYDLMINSTSKSGSTHTHTHTDRYRGDLQVPSYIGTLPLVSKS